MILSHLKKPISHQKNRTHIPSHSARSHGYNRARASSLHSALALILPPSYNGRTQGLLDSQQRTAVISVSLTTDCNEFSQ